MTQTWRASCMFHEILGCAPAAFEEAQTCRCLLHLRFDNANSSAKKASWQWNNLNIFKRNKDIACKGCISRTFGASWVPPLFLAFWNWIVLEILGVSSFEGPTNIIESRNWSLESPSIATYDNHPGLGSQGNLYKTCIFAIVTGDPTAISSESSQRFPPEANPKELKAAEPRSPSTATVLRPRSFRAWASSFSSCPKRQDMDDQINPNQEKPMENPPEFFRVISTWKGKWTTIYYKLADTSTTQHKPMVVLGSIELSRIGKIWREADLDTLYHPPATAARMNQAGLHLHWSDPDRRRLRIKDQQRRWLSVFSLWIYPKHQSKITNRQM